VGLRKTTKYLSQDSRSPGRDLNPGPTEHEAGEVTARPAQLLLLGGCAVISLSKLFSSEDYLSFARFV
jgi:hypothetical protein